MRPLNDTVIEGRNDSNSFKRTAQTNSSRTLEAVSLTAWIPLDRCGGCLEIGKIGREDPGVN